MAVKKTSKAGETSAPKAGARKGAAKKSAAPKAAEASAAPVASETAAKASAPKGAAKKSAGDGGAAPKKKAEIKLNDRQRDLLKKIHGAGESGYRIGEKVEQRTIDALESRKLLKKGAKDKASGTSSYVLTKAGQKHLGPEA